MKFITKDTGYAIRALCAMSCYKDEIISVSELVRMTKIPRPFLRKILQVLNKHGVIKSFRGKGGGFALEREPQKIYLADVMGIFQGRVKLIEHLFQRKPCPYMKACILKRRLDGIEKLVSQKLNSITVASLMKKR